MLRQKLRSVMGFIAKWAIRKHSMKIIIVSGWYGTEITRELSYIVLNSKFSVRRNLINPWWDLSIPLDILGYEDVQRSKIKWIGLIIKIILRLIFGRRYKHYVVLNINCINTETIKYWAEFIMPSCLILTGYKEESKYIDKLITNTIKNKGKIIYNYKDKNDLKGVLYNYQKTYSFGFGKNGNFLQIEEGENSSIYSCFQDQVSLRKNILPGINHEIIACALLLGKINKIDLKESLYAIIKYGVPKRLLMQIKANLKI